MFERQQAEADTEDQGWVGNSTSWSRPPASSSGSPWTCVVLGKRINLSGFLIPQLAVRMVITVPIL